MYVFRYECFNTHYLYFYVYDELIRKLKRLKNLCKINPKSVGFARVDVVEGNGVPREQ
jgi:hypothetical protein